jgi:tetratricopeptide (TPR) repeat protein
MPSYSVRDVERVLRLSPQVTRGLVRAGFVKPARGARREYRFSFQDLIVLRTARALMQAHVPAQRIRRSLDRLRRSLPESMPLSGLSISAVGDRVVVREGESRWQADSGQYLLGLDVSLAGGELHMVEHRETAPSELASAEPAPARDWFGEALALESTDPPRALAAYRHAADEDPHNAAAWINLGRLLHLEGKTAEAEGVYRRALDQVGPDPLLLFNQGVLLEDLGKTAAALAAYQTALAEDPDLAGQYRRLVSSDGRP